MKKYLAIFSLIFFLYSIVPTLWLRMFSKKVIKESGEKGIMLTFDDGPNPAYTGKVLDLLKKYQIKAIFFVVASKAIQYPELIIRMKNEGHVIGIHHHTHKSSFIMTPFELKKQLENSRAILERIIDEPIYLYRPPYGHFNISTPSLAKDLQMMSWSGMFGDWKTKTCQTKLLIRLQENVEDGKIYVLHDCGKNFGADDAAPKYMIEVLEQFLKDNEQIIFTDAKQWSEELVCHENEQ